MIEIHGVSYTYMEKTPFEKTALRGISFSVSEGEYSWRKNFWRR